MNAIIFLCCHFLFGYMESERAGVGVGADVRCAVYAVVEASLMGEVS